MCCTTRVVTVRVQCHSFGEFIINDAVLFFILCQPSSLVCIQTFALHFFGLFFYFRPYSCTMHISDEVYVFRMDDMSCAVQR